ncbi:MAG: hypothetical protein ACK559_04150, partial [bacterium]
HNGEGYDNHIMMKALFETNNKLSPETITNINNKLQNYSQKAKDIITKIMNTNLSISCIAKTSEKLMSMSNGLIDIHDSYKLTISSLHTLIYNLVWIEPVECKQCSKTIKDTSKIYHDEKYFIGEFVCRHCQKYGHQLPIEIRKIDKRTVYEKFKCMCSIVTEDNKINDDKLCLLLRKG